MWENVGVDMSRGKAGWEGLRRAWGGAGGWDGSGEEGWELGWVVVCLVRLAFQGLRYMLFNCKCGALRIPTEGADMVLALTFTRYAFISELEWNGERGEAFLLS